MLPTPSGALKIFSFRGINVWVHWTWAIVAWIQLQFRKDEYSNVLWAAGEYLTLFAIVLLHEFGHALACRSVGGRADTIVLWPLGGVAYVQPPQRPWPYLWSIIAGPLVNAVLIVPTFAVWYAAERAGWGLDALSFVRALAVINLGLLIFNMLPVYPLDGGQTLRGVLWLFIGPAHSLLIASLIGLAASVIGFLVVLRVGGGNYMLLALAAFAAIQSFFGFQRARAMLKWEQIPRHQHARCPNCQASAPAVPMWRCDACATPFDMVATHGVCPSCASRYQDIPCPSCGQRAPIAMWFVVAHAPPPYTSPVSWASRN